MGRGSRAWALTTAVCLAMTTSSWRAHAEPPSGRQVPVHVLGFDSEDAEEQADAITTALRAQIRQSSAYSLIETTHSLAVLAAALKCPPRPDQACLTRISDQIHADHFVWGLATKSNHRVSIEAHLFSRGKADEVARDVWPEGSKDPDDEMARKSAARILERLAGTATTGTMRVHAGADGDVYIDGEKRVRIRRGDAAIEIQPGTYAVEVRARGFKAAQQQVTVEAGKDISVAFEMLPDTPEVHEEEPSISPRKVVMYGTLGVGGVLLAGAVIEGVRFLSLQADNERDHQDADLTGIDFCRPPAGTSAEILAKANQACDTLNSAETARTLGFVFLATGLLVGGAGVALLVTEPKASDAARSKAALNRPPVWLPSPQVGPHGGGLQWRGVF